MESLFSPPRWLQSFLATLCQWLPYPQRREQAESGLSLRTLLAVPTIALILAIAIAIGWLSFLNTRRAVANLVSQLVTETSHHVEQQLADHLHQPHLVNQLNADALRLGQLDVDDFEVMQRYFWQQIQHFDNLGLISFVTTDNEMIEISRLRSERLQVDVVRRFHPNAIYSYGLDSKGNRTELIETISDFNPQRTPPGYANAIAAGGPTWNPIFSLTGVPHMVISASMPAYDASGTFRGVFFADFLLHQLGPHLAALKVGSSGQVFVVEETGKLVSSSAPEEPFTLEKGEPQQLSATDSNTPEIRATARFLEENYSSWRDFDRPTPVEFRYEGDRYVVKILPFQDEFGLDWSIAVVVPQADFTEQIRADARGTILLCFLALLGAVLLAGWLARRLSRAIGGEIAATQAIAREVSAADLGWEFRRSTPPSRIRELRVLAEAIDRVAYKVQAALAELQHKAFYDPLTELANVNLLCERLREAGDRSAQFTLFAIAIERLREIEYGLGEDIGEQILVAVARRLETCLGEGDLLARIGDSEFAILYAALPEESAAATAARLHAALEKPLAIGKTRIAVRACIGIAWALAPETLPESYLRAAATALDRASQDGQRRTIVYHPRMQKAAADRVALEADLRAAIAAEELQVYYQPIVSLTSGQVQGFEALARWSHPTRGRVSPGKFIPVAEETGAIVDLGRWVLLEACRELIQWQQYDRELSVSVNLSPVQLHHPSLLADVESAVAMLPRGGLKLEITESCFLNNLGGASDRLEQLRNCKIEIAIDDFGTGYSSLSYLQRLPIDILKIDRAFINRIASNRTDFDIAKAIVTLARTLDLRVIAEGIETERQAEVLRDLGCDCGQGYWFARPLPASSVEAFLAGKRPFSEEFASS